MTNQPNIQLDISTLGKVFNTSTQQFEILGGLNIAYRSDELPFIFARCTNPYTGEQYLRTLTNGVIARIDIHYLCPWHIELFNDKVIIADLTVHFKNCVAAFEFATSALGDTIAWIPIINAWAEKNEVQKALVHTKWNYIFNKEKYPKLQFIENPEEFKHIPGLKIYHRVGHALAHERLLNKRINHANSVNWKDTNMFDSQNYSLGLPSQELKPELVNLPKERLIQGKYVTICNESSQRIKHLLNPKVWLALSYKLKELGYQVVNVGNRCPIIPEVITTNGAPFENVMRIIRDAEFHIGLSSGLSWLAWAYGKPVLMLGNFTNVGYEFSTNIVRVIDTSDYYGIFNNCEVPWEATWGYDPFKDNVSIARRVSARHALKALEVLMQRLGNDFKGIYVTQDNRVNPIQKLQPRELPKYLTKK